MGWMDGRTEDAVSFALDEETSKRLNDNAFDRGLNVVESIVDGKTDGIDRLMKAIRHEEVSVVYVDSLWDLCKTFRKGAEILTEIRMHNLKIVLPDWEIDPLRDTFEAVIHTLSDLSKRDSKYRSDAIKRGQRYSEEKYGRKGGRPRKRLPLHEIAVLRSKGLAWSRISKELDIPTMTLYDRRESIELYMKDYGMDIPSERT